MGLKKCRSCGEEISKTASRCPKCNGYVWTTMRKMWLLLLILFVIIPMIKGCFELANK